MLMLLPFSPGKWDIDHQSEARSLTKSHLGIPSPKEKRKYSQPFGDDARQNFLSIPTRSFLRDQLGGTLPL
jgi:hypothetical protein